MTAAAKTRAPGDTLEGRYRLIDRRARFPRVASPTLEVARAREPPDPLT